jgi:hypothetical protein
VLLGVVGHGGNAAQAAVTRAAARTADGGSSRFTLTWYVPGLPAKEVARNSVKGTMDYAHHRGQVTYSSDMQVRNDSDVIYMRWPMPWRDEPVWVRVPLDSSAPDPLDLQSRALDNPVGLLSFLTGASDDVRTVGSEEVRGTPTTHYEGTLDLQKVVDQAPADQRAELQDTLNFIGEDMSTKGPFGLWVDDAGVAHRLRIDETGGYSATIEYHDFGLPVVIEPPPANEIISAEQLSSELMQHADDSSCDQDDAGSDGVPSTGSAGSAELGPPAPFPFLGGVPDSSDQSGSAGGYGSSRAQIRLCVVTRDE